MRKKSLSQFRGQSLDLEYKTNVHNYQGMEAERTLTRNNFILSFLVTLFSCPSFRNSPSLCSETALNLFGEQLPNINHILKNIKVLFVNQLLFSSPVPELNTKLDSLIHKLNTSFEYKNKFC